MEGLIKKCVAAEKLACSINSTKKVQKLLFVKKHLTTSQVIVQKESDFKFQPKNERRFFSEDEKKVDYNRNKIIL